MYKVLLVDDESIFLEHLSAAIPWETYGCEICGKAKDGITTIEAVKHLKPDIVFMDINLPNMNGLEVCDKIREFHNPPHVIVMTAHGEFSFAHKAIKLGVFDYMLKPFDAEELARALEKCVESIQRTREHQLLQKSRAVNEAERYFKNLLELGEVGNAEWLHVPENAGFLVSVLRMHHLHHRNLPEAYEDIGAFIDSTHKVCSYGTGIHNGAVVILHIIDSHVELRCIKEAYAEMLAHDAEQSRTYDCIALGTLVPTLEEVPRSYQRAITALENRSRTGGSVVAYQDVEALNHPVASYSMQDINLLIKLFETGQYESADTAIEKIFALSEGQMLSFQYVIAAYHSLLTSIYSRFQVRDTKAIDYLTTQRTLFNELNTCISTKEIVDILKNNIHEVFSDCISLQIPQRSDVLIMKIERYLGQHYNQGSLSVSQIAQALFFENSYIRRVYKLQMGKTIMQRLEEIRMEKAKELLERTDLKNSDIAERVGYADPFHFSKRFKLYTNLAPTDYRNLYQLKNDKLMREPEQDEE